MLHSKECWLLSDLSSVTSRRSATTPDDAEQGTPGANLLPVWYLVRQDLYLNDQATAFLIVHWKHTLNLISLLDVIPGAGTELIIE